VRRDLVHQMLRILYDAAVYIPIEYAPEIQAYRTDRFEGWIRQPADVGPVMFSNTSPSYFNLRPVGGGAGGGTNWIPIAIGAAVVLIGGGVALAAVRRRGASVDERE
jgi:peptide/nickel transport system substrate-binding protein